MDKKAKQILFQTYWKNGWIDDKDRHTSPDDFQYAKEKGLMFDPLTISHDECVEKIIELRDKITKHQAAKAFLSSLSTRRLDWRSGIASYAVAQQVIPHTFVKSGSTCAVCRDTMNGELCFETYHDEDLNVLNFERIKWGGVRHGDFIYTLLDLEQFQKEEIPEPTPKDISLFKDILQIVETSVPKDYPGALRKRLRTIPELKTTKDEMGILMEILACIGVLRPASYDRPTTGKHDWDHIEYWRGVDKYDKAAVEHFFGEYL